MGIDIFFSMDGMSESWNLIYDQHNFPFVIRYHLTDWLESKSWIDLKSDNSASTAQIYDGLLLELEKKIKETQGDKLTSLQLINARKKIREDFGTRPADLVDVLKKCFSSERLLIASSTPDTDRESTEEDIELLKYREKETAFGKVIAVLKQQSQQQEVSIEAFHNFMQTTVASIKDMQDHLADLQTGIQRNIVNTTKTKEVNQLHTQICRGQQAIQESKKKMLVRLTKESQDLYQMLKGHCWALVAYYKQQQKLTTCYLAKPPEGAIDTLNKVCEDSGRHLKTYIDYVDRVLADFDLCNYGDDDSNAVIRRLKDDLGNILSQHLEVIFVITKQPMNVQKIVQAKSAAMLMCVRILGGKGLGIEHSLPSVSVQVYSELKLVAALNADQPTSDAACKSMENGTNVMMELKRATGHIQANLNNVLMRGVERLERRDKEDRVTEHKHGIVFYTKVNVCNKLYPIKALSLPIVLTSQTSQNGAAKGTLLWDAAFSDPNRSVYEDAQSVPWPKMKEVLMAIFKETGRALDENQLKYIARYLFKTGQLPEEEEDFSKCILTKEKFLREKVAGRDFTFWRWIFACTNLITKFVRKEWTDNMIYGFIGRQESEKLLRGKKPGTFLLRFRERRLEDSQRTLKCACLALAIVGKDTITGEPNVVHVKDHLTPSEIHEYSLTRLLSSMVDVNTQEALLTTLYPDTDFNEVIKNYVPDSGEASDGYMKTRLLIGVMNGRKEEQESTDGSCYEDSLAASSPDWNMSDIGSNLPSVCSPLSQDLENIQMEALMSPNVDYHLLLMPPAEYQQ